MKAALLILLCALALPACGPGVTGTGTGGTVGLDAFNASELAVCGAPFAETIGCASPTAAPPQQLPSPLARASYFEGGSGASLVRVRLEGNTIEITAPCTGFKFDGIWGRSAALGDRFYGAQVLDNGALLQPATATVVAIGGNLQVHIQDVQAQTLLGPAAVQPQAAAPAAGVCP